MAHGIIHRQEIILLREIILLQEVTHREPIQLRALILHHRKEDSLLHLKEEVLLPAETAGVQTVMAVLLQDQQVETDGEVKRVEVRIIINKFLSSF